MARIPKFAMLPMVNPPARQKEATTAATSTSSLSNAELCSSEGADIMHRLKSIRKGKRH
jgi:hypothetical protein